MCLEPSPRPLDRRARGLVHGHLANSLLGGSEDDDPIATSSAEAKTRAAGLRWALCCVSSAVALMALLTARIRQ